MKAYTHHGGEEFEVTEADMVQVAPLGFSTPNLDPAGLIDALKAHLGDLTEYLPTGFWDAYLDEGDFEHVGCGDEMCGDPDHYICTRPSSMDRDDVFVRIPMAFGAGGDIDLQVYSRNQDDTGRAWPRARVTINGEDYPPEDCIKDLAALLSVFRFYVARGDL